MAEDLRAEGRLIGEVPAHRPVPLDEGPQRLGHGRVPAQPGALGRLGRPQDSAQRRRAVENWRVLPRRHARSLGKLSDMTITNGKPEGYTTLTPFLVCSPAAEAIPFYQEVFGATVVSRMDGPDGTVMHADLAFGDARLQLADTNEQYGLVVPARSGDSVSGSTCIYVA